ncbi:MAG: hypothetical protein ABSG15_05730 [FCB group bacterium]
MSLLQFSLNSCSKNSTGPENTFVNYLPTKMGTYWVYDVYTLDSNGNRTSNIPTIDSTIISGTITKLGLVGSIFTSYTIDSSGTSTGTDTYYRSDSSKIYAFTNLITNMLPSQIPLPINDAWLLIINPNSDLWRIYEQTVTDLQLFVGVTITGDLNVEGSNEGTEMITIASNNFTARKFLIKMTFIGNLTTGTQTIPITYERKIYQDYVENIGLVKSHIEPSVLPLIITSFKMDGEDDILNRYNIVH